MSRTQNSPQRPAFYQLGQQQGGAAINIVSRPSRIAVLAALALTILPIAALGIQPLFYGVVADRIGLGLDKIAQLLTLEQVGNVIGTVIAFALIGRVKVSWVVFVGSVVAIVATVLTAVSTSFPTIAVVRFAGGLGGSTIYACGLFLIGRMDNSERLFGAGGFSQTVAWVVYAMLFPKVSHASGPVAALLTPALWFAPVLVFAFMLPKPARGRDLGAASVLRVLRQDTYSGVALVALFLFQAAIFAQWGFLERVGRHAGLSLDAVGWAFGIGILGGLPGSAIPMVLGRRFGDLIPIAVGTGIVMTASAIFWMSPAPQWHFLTAAVLLNLGWILASTYFMGLVANTDGSGTTTKLIAFAQGIGTAAGPFAVSLAANASVSSIFVISSLFAAASCLTVIFARSLPGVRVAH